MLKHDVIDLLAFRDTSELVDILRSNQLIDTDAGDALMGHFAGHYPDQYAALVVALARGEVAA